jgi:hypothetical protein
VKVYVQHNQALSEELGVNANLFINIYSHKTSFKQGDAKTKFFDLNLDGLDQPSSQRALSALRALFKKNSTELIERSYPHFMMKDDFHSRLATNKLFVFQWDKMAFNHEIRIQPPLKPGENYDPAKYERILFHDKVITRTGTNFFGFFTDIGGLFTNGVMSSAAVTRPNENPANRPFGKGRSFSISTEAEITEGYDFKPLTIIEEVFAGWRIGKPRLMRAFDKLEKKIAGIPMPRKIINRDVFNDTKTIQQFELRSTVILYDRANEVIKKVVFNKLELNTYNVMIQFFGGLEAFKEYCESMISSGNGEFIKYQGEKNYQCMAPWMMEIMDIRQKGVPTDKKKLVRLYNRINRILFKNAEWDRILPFLGEGNFLMIVKVGGFRRGDEGAINNEGTTQYVSDTLGEFDSFQGAGIFRDFMSQFGISSYQMNANFFSEGF